MCITSKLLLSRILVAGCAGGGERSTHMVRVSKLIIACLQEEKRFLFFFLFTRYQGTDRMSSMSFFFLFVHVLDFALVNRSSREYGLYGRFCTDYTALPGSRDREMGGEGLNQILVNMLDLCPSMLQSTLYPTVLYQM